MSLPAYHRDCYLTDLETVVAFNLQGMGPVRSDRLPAAFILANQQADIDWSSVHSTFDAPVPVN